MTRNPSDANLVSFSVGVYQLLLNMYPTQFRQEYGADMLQVFRDCCLRAFHHGGKIGILKLWIITLLDFLRSVLTEHMQKEIDMSKSSFIRLSGWSLILGAVTFSLFLLGDYIENNVYDPFRRFQAFSEYSFLLSVWVTPILLGVGLLGLRIRYGNKTGSFGKNILLLGAISGITVNLLGALLASNTEWGWLLLFTGNGVLLACLAIFGGIAMRVKPMQRWNSLPLLAGIWYPTFFLIAAIYILTTNRPFPNALNQFSLITILQGIALIMLGFELQGDVPEKILATA